jgi:tetratricopeptide (TPR) repeat protein
LFVTDLGYAYLLNEQLSEAESAFKQGIALEPTRPHAYGHLVECILREPNRWEKRTELFGILEQGTIANSDRERRLKIEVARIRAEHGFGSVERAREHIEEALRSHPPRLVEKQLLEIKASLAEDEKARALRDWPEPDLPAKARERFAVCETMSGSSRKKETLACLTELLAQYPAWRAPRRLRVKILTVQGHYDEAVKDLSTLSRLEPSEPAYFRQLGLLLAEHGGLLELERADVALHMALTLEPEWTELSDVRQRLAARRTESFSSAKQVQQPLPRPTENAQRLYEEAEASLGEGADGRAAALPLVEQALRESPTYVEAAALSYSLTRRVPEKTVEALWRDGARLLALYQECAHIEPAMPRAVLDRWLTRAIELGNVEARLTRALNQRARGDKPGAERELANYLALVGNREEIESVQLLRSELLDKPKSGAGVVREAILNARVRLLANDPEGALRQLDAPCRGSMESDRLLWLGIVYEHQGQVAQALSCYDFGLGQAPADATHVRLGSRLARLLARAEPQWLTSANTTKLAPLVSIEPAAEWALARSALETGKVETAKLHVARYLKAVAPDHRFASAARAMQQKLLASDRLQVERKRHRVQLGLAIAVSVLVLLGLVVYGVWFWGVTVARAVRQRPRLFPELRRVVGHLRHDVLKHRTSALELLAQDPSTLPKLRATLLEPVPVSAVLTEAYTQLRVAARAQGVTLRRLEREPVFGALLKDLRLVERSLDDMRHAPLIQRLDARLRTVHPDQLQRLLAQGPRFELDAVAIQRWIASLQAELTGRGQPWTVPALQMSDLTLPFPVDEGALFQVFANLLRNAQAAVKATAKPKILVRLLREADFAGRTWVKLQIGDNAEAELSDADLENRAPDRGLGIVRDTSRDWHGRIVIQRESSPYHKTLSVEFAL